MVVYRFKRCVSRVLTRLGCTNRTEAALLASAPDS
jgi:DNA-binding NarL/FixJ family response regulator